MVTAKSTCDSRWSVDRYKTYHCVISPAKAGHADSPATCIIASFPVVHRAHRAKRPIAAIGGGRPGGFVRHQCLKLPDGLILFRGLYEYILRVPVQRKLIIDHVVFVGVSCRLLWV